MILCEHCGAMIRYISAADGAKVFKCDNNETFIISESGSVRKGYKIHECEKTKTKTTALKPEKKTKTKTAKAGKTEKKTAAKTKTAALKSEKNLPDYTLPDGSFLDLDSFDFGSQELNEREKLFVIWYTFPNTDTYHKPFPAALKAGYSKKTANVVSYSMRLKPHIQKAIERVSRNLEKIRISEAYNKYLDLTMRRAEFDPADYYESYTYTDKAGNEREGIRIKRIEDLTPEQRQLAGGIEVKGVTPTYILPDKRKEMDLIMRLYEQANGGGDDGNGLNVELTLDAVREKVGASVRMRRASAAIQTAGGDYRYCADEVSEED